MIPTTTQYADANEAKQLTEDDATEPHVAIIIRDYLIPLFSFEIEQSWSDPDWIALRAPKSASVDAALTVLPRSGCSIGVCTKSNHDRRRERRSSCGASRAVRCLNVTSYIRLHRRARPEVRVRGMLADRSSRSRLHSLSDLRHVGHETQRCQVDPIDLPLGTTHARPSTNARAADWDPMISFAEQRSLSEKLRFPEPTRTLPAVFI